MRPELRDDFTGTKRFEVRRRLGQGGMGVVYEAYDHQRRQRVALKTILRLDASSLYRFKSEFRALADVNHPNLVRLYDLFADDDPWFFTMELVDGLDFLDYVCSQDDPIPDVLDGGVTPIPETHFPLLQEGPSDPDSPSDPRRAGSPRAADRAAEGHLAAESPAGVRQEGGSGREIHPGPPRDLSYKELSASSFTDGRSPLARPVVAVPGLSPCGCGAEERAPAALSPGAAPSPGGGADEGARVSGAPYHEMSTISEGAADKSPVEALGFEVAPQAGDGLPRTETRANPVRLRRALRQLAEGLGALHALGKLHRDIKPSNVMVSPAGRVVLLDFGLATEFEGPGDLSLADGQIVGTIPYMSPEQAAGQTLTPASDWYSFGVMLYQALTGRVPFEGGRLDALTRKQTEDPPAPDRIATGVAEDLNTLCVDLLRRCPSGRPNDEEVFLRLGAEPDGPAATRPSGRRPFIGREAHLAALAGDFAEARQQRTAVASLVHGRSGAGKTALARRFLDGLVHNQEGAVILAGRCSEHEAVAFKALDTLIDALSRHLRHLTTLEAERLMPRDVAVLARVFPVLRRVRAVADAPPREIPDPQELRRRAFAALRELLGRIADRRPLVLLIDDLQWGDLDSARLLVDLLRPPEAPALLLIACYRSEDADHSPCLQSLLGAADARLPLRELPVGPMTPEEGSDLAISLLGREDPAAWEQAEAISRQAWGSPGFIYELVQYHRAGHSSAQHRQRTGEITLDEVLWSRIRHLPAGTLRLLEVLAIAGQRLPQDFACRVAGLESGGSEALDVLRAERLARRVGAGESEGIETYHNRIRETVRRHLPQDVRQELHRLLAEAWASTPGVDPETLANHFKGAGQLEAAGHHYVRAADAAAESLAFDRAIKLYRRALELLPPDDAGRRAVRTRCADALANAGRGLEAARAYQEAAAEADPADVIELHRRAAYQFLISGNTEEGLEAFRLLLAQVGMWLSSTPRRTMLRVMYYRVRIWLRGLGFRERAATEIPPGDLLRIDICRSVALGTSVVDVIRGANWQSQTLLRALRAGEPMRLVSALAWDAAHVAAQGRVSHHRTARRIRIAQALAQRIGHPEALGTATLSAGCAEFLEGRFRTGLEQLDAAAAILRERCTGVIWELDTAHIFGLWSLIYLGRLGELGVRFPLLLKEARERGDRYLEATIGTYIGTIARLAADEAEEARMHAEEAVRHWSSQRFHVQHLDLFYAHLYIDLYTGDGASAWRRIGETRRVLDQSLLLRIQQVRIDVLQLRGRSAVAAAAGATDPRPLLRAAAGSALRLDRERVPWASALAVLIRAGAAAVGGDAPRAALLLADAIAACEAADLGLFAAAARRRRGELLGGDEGRALIAQADAWMTEQTIRNPARMASCFAPGFSE